MSKSDASDLSRINMTGDVIDLIGGRNSRSTPVLFLSLFELTHHNTDSQDTIHTKIRRAVTDDISQITFEPEVSEY